MTEVAKIRTMLATALVAGALVAASPVGAPSAAACSGSLSDVKTLKQGIRTHRAGSNETISLRTLHIEAEVSKKKYKIGDIIKIPVEVTRPAEEDPLNLGIPMDRPIIMPAEDVNVGVGLIVGDVFLPGFGRTDENGQTVIQVRVERWVEPAPANATFYAWSIAAETPCARVEEYGFRPYPNFFNVTRRR